MVRVIDLDNTLDRQRYRCPRGHAKWEPWNGYLYCWSCSSHNWDVDPQFEELHDKKTGETLRRDDVEFVRRPPAGQVAD